MLGAGPGAATGSGSRIATPPRPRLSSVLAGLAADRDVIRIRVFDGLSAMEDRAFGALLLVFAIPNVLPTPPGAGILGLPLVVLSLQLATGRMPWLPETVSTKSLERQKFSALVDRAMPLLQRAERLLRPRMDSLLCPAAERALGWFCLLLSIVLLLPIPFGNMLPALAICILALGLLERDGLWILFGAAFGCAAIALVAGGLFLLARTALNFATA